MIAGPHSGHPQADPLDHTRALMAEHRRLGHQRLDAGIGVADAGRHDTHQDLVLARLVEVERLEPKGTLGLLENREP